MTTLLLNETLVKFPLLSDGEKNSFSLISFEIGQYAKRSILSLTHSLSRRLSSPLMLFVPFLLLSRIADNTFYLHTHISISATHFALFWRSQTRDARKNPTTSFYFFAQKRVEKNERIKNLNTTEFQPFRIVKIFQWLYS